uniref:Interleukin-12 subunit alpha n=1 Tax=Cyprinus carpio TaxID=7962 RepID=A0A8C1Y5S3_CYPCA
MHPIYIMYCKMQCFVTDLVVSIACFALLCRCSIGGPVGARESPLNLTGKCNELARSLLWNVSAVLEMDHLFSGFDCSQQNAEVHLRRQTVSACTPQNSNCAHSAVLNIDENECLQRILEDLHYYRETLRAYSNPELTNSVVWSIDDLLQNCFSVSVMDISPAKVSVDHQKSFQERLQLCKVLKGFNLRTITINRVFNYILSK